MATRRAVLLAAAALFLPGTAGTAADPVAVTLVAIDARLEVAQGEIANVAVIGTPDGSAGVAFCLQSDPRQRFAVLTRENVGRTIEVWIDGERVAAPVVRAPITSGCVSLSGLRPERATALASRLGATPSEPGRAGR